MTHKTIKGCDGDVHYWISDVFNKNGAPGECTKETILFIHGALMDHNLFSEQVSFFSRDYRVITVDVPGHGLSALGERFSLNNAALDILELLDKEGVTDVHLVGQSMGGYIAQLITLKQPGKVQTLTVVDTTPLQPSYYKKLTSLHFEKFILSLLPYRVLVKAMINKVAFTLESQDYVKRIMKSHTKSKLLDLMIQIPAEVLGCAREVPLPIPVLITYGEKDDSMNIKKYSRKWAEQEQRKLQVIPDAAHNANMDNPEVFNRILHEFLQKNSSV